MIISVHQPQYLPWLGYFHKMYQSDSFVFLDNVQYKKREYQNSNCIRTKDGSIWLTVPILKEVDPYPKISAVRIDNSQGWRKMHWMTIRANYSHAPFFKQYSGFFEELYNKEWKLLVDLNMHIIRHIAGLLSINTPISLESQLNITTTKTSRLVDICKALKADTYLSGVGGKDYLDEEQFKLNGIKLIYQDFKHPQYKQCHEPFVPCISIIDLLFNCGDESLKILTRGQ
jgi:hypothetical protein